MANKRIQNKQEKAEPKQGTTRFNNPDKQVLYIMGLIEELNGEGVLPQRKVNAIRALRMVLNPLVYPSDKYPELYNR